MEHVFYVLIPLNEADPCASPDTVGTVGFSEDSGDCHGIAEVHDLVKFDQGVVHHNFLKFYSYHG